MIDGRVIDLKAARRLRDASEMFARARGAAPNSPAATELGAWCAQDPANRATLDQVTSTWELLGAVELTAAAGPPPRMIGRRAMIGGAMAAGLAAATVIGRGDGLSSDDAAGAARVWSTEKGEQRRIAAGPMISIDLNTGSQLADLGGHGRREFRLIDGEALFDAGPRLLVRLGAGSAETARGRFIARRDGAAAVVTCLAGRVAVAVAGKFITLAERQRVSLTDAGLGALASIDTEVSSAWTAGLLIVRDQPVSEVVRELNRYRAGHIVVASEELGRRSLSGVLHLSRMAEAVAHLERVTGARAVELPGGLLILR